VDNLEKKSDATIKGFAIGEVTDIHEVTIAVEEAQIAFNLLLEIRNKLLETYQEVMRMQV
jgi:flagellar hook-basal body complex protein FliE